MYGCVSGHRMIWEFMTYHTTVMHHKICLYFLAPSWSHWVGRSVAAAAGHPARIAPSPIFAQTAGTCPFHTANDFAKKLNE